jgi:hypothetical protein
MLLDKLKCFQKYYDKIFYFQRSIKREVEHIKE